MLKILVIHEESENENETDREIRKINENLGRLQRDSQSLDNPEALDALERDILEQTNHLAAILLQQQLQSLLDSEENKAKESVIIAAWPGKMKSEGYQNVAIRTASGHEITLRGRYYRRNCDRKNGKRHKGVYAGLLSLGIHERTTPRLAALISGWAALLCSFNEVCQVLAEQGLPIGEKVVRRIAYGYAERARIFQQTQQLPPGETVKGRRVVVSIDGGRLRVRENKKGSKTAKGRHRYHGTWREPKLFIVYVVNEKGKMEQSFAPLIDGGLQGADALFQLLFGYLQSLDIQAAEQVLFVADGAHWIWNRVHQLTGKLGLKPEQVQELIDFYHAVEHLHQIATLRRGWSAKQRRTWVKKQRRLLAQGQIDSVLDALQTVYQEQKSQAIATELYYFIGNRQRIDYLKVKSRHLPIGSGAVESAIRRVVNLRLKGASIFWHEANAEKILMLRAFFKTGRWNQMKSMACSPFAVAYE
ncbi:MAG: hypothetical protein VBE63_23705 [Lamprobacter sp.]|uniref:hypothetical protein n=1 Tax=Lamprobacter sp. TaxID=3100796 RepID=UPI002B25CA4A|nr:hypothetical protein [Lamprobacter sp.]MEA3642922.1 hypothetical protein [Lamprobacter sp.]